MHKKMTSLVALVVILAIVLAVNLISSLLFQRVRLDITEEKLFTLSEGSKNIAASLDGEVTLKFFNSKTAMQDIPMLKNYAARVSDLLKEFVVASKGNLMLEIIDPRPDTEDEEAADLSGIQGVQVQQGGDRIFLGLQILDKESGGNETIIPFFDPSRESTLEYDIAKAIYTVARPDKKRIGVISSLPVMGSEAPMSNPMMPPQQQQGQEPWAIISQLENSFDVQEISTDASVLPSDLDLLVIIHPKGLSASLEYAIDQYMVKGGNALMFVDALCYEEMAASAQMMRSNPQMAMQQTFHSEIPKPFSSWGVALRDAAADANPMGMGGGPTPGIVAAPEMAIREVPSQTGGSTKMFTLLDVRKDNINRSDIVTSELEDVFLVLAGALKDLDGREGMTVETLLSSTKDAAVVDGMMMKFTGNPLGLNEQYKAGLGVPMSLAYRAVGKFKTTFPEGKPVEVAEGSAPTFEEDKDQVKQGEKSGVFVVVSDVDFITDQHAVRKINFLGRVIIQDNPDNDNFGFLANTAEFLTGNSDLISLRSRGKSKRPFEKIEKIQQEAEASFRKEEEKLQEKLDKANQEWEALKSETKDSEVLSKEFIEKRKQVREEQVNTRKELREVRRQLREDVEALKTRYKLVNIALMPALVILLGLCVFLLKAMRRRRVR